MSKMLGYKCLFAEYFEIYLRFEFCKQLAIVLYHHSRVITEAHHSVVQTQLNTHIYPFLI